MGTVDERGTIDAPAGTVDERGTANAPQGTVDRRGTIGAPAAEGSGSKKKAYGKGFKPTKQHLHELVKAELILAGDIIRYEDRNKYDCTIIVSILEASYPKVTPLSISSRIMKITIHHCRSEESAHVIT